MEDYSFLFSVLGLLAVAVLWFVYQAYIVRVWHRQRGKYIDRTRKPLDTKLIEKRLATAQRAARWLSFFYSFTRRTKFFIILGAAVLLAGLYAFVPVDTLAQGIWRLVFSAAILAGLAIALSYWHAWAEQQERYLADQIQSAEEQLLLSFGVTTRHTETGLYTRDFLIHMLETFLNQIGEPVPLTCLMMEIRGLAEFEQKHGRENSMEVLTRVGQTLSHSVRPYDLTGHHHDRRLTLILLRYPADAPAGDRLAAAVQHRVLDEINQTYKSDLELAWSRATLPDDAPTPVQLLSCVSSALDQGK